MPSSPIFNALSLKNRVKLAAQFPVAMPIEDEYKPERQRCAGQSAHDAEACIYFIENYVQIYDARNRRWIPFVLWDFQKEAVAAMLTHKYLAWLKARQLGATWIALAVALWETLFWPIAQNLLFSRREVEAAYLLGKKRFSGMYTRLPLWMKQDTIIVEKYTEFALSNGSSVMAFPSNAGDSYTGTRVIVDEADLVSDLDDLLQSVEPVIEHGGSIVLIFRPYKKRPASLAKNIFRAAVRGISEYYPIFTPWYANPTRSQEFYDTQVKSSLEKTGTLDTVYENYPATVEEALAPEQKGKRLPHLILERCYQPEQVIKPTDAPDYPDLRIYEEPQRNHRYVIGMDSAEGLASSDNSVSLILDVDTGKQVAILTGKIAPTIQSAMTAVIADYYNKAWLMPEANNHGYTVVQWFLNNGYRSRVLHGHIKNKYGWTTTSTSKVILYDSAADALEAGELTITDDLTFASLAAIESGTLEAPPGADDEVGMIGDDEAMAFVIANQGRIAALKRGGAVKAPRLKVFNRNTPARRRARR